MRERRQISERNKTKMHRAKKKKRPLFTVSLSSVVMALNVLSSREPCVVTAIPVRRGLCPQDWIVSSKRVGTLKLALVNIFFFMERSPAWLPCGG